MTSEEINKKVRRAHIIGSIWRYVILIAVGILMIYPLLWMVSATFKKNSEIFTSISLWVNDLTTKGYKEAMTKSNGIDIWRALLNTYSYVIPRVIFTVISATVTAYGFGRFKFKGRDILFAVLMSTLFLPQVVLNVPQYLMYNNFGWLANDFARAIYLPIVIPALFACDTYFVFMLIQFLHNVPRELEEAAKIDGCNLVQTLVKVIVPMLMPAVVSCALFQFMWSSNDFMGPLLYASSVPSKVPATLFLRNMMDGEKGFEWNRILASSLITITPSLIVFFLAQDQFVDGISAGGVKG